MSNTTDSTAVAAATTSAIFTSETTFVTSPTTTAAEPTTTAAVDTPTTTSTTPVVEPTTTSTSTSTTAPADTTTSTTPTITTTSTSTTSTSSAESTSAEVFTTVIVVTPSGTTGAKPTTIYITSTASNAAATSVEGGSASSTSSGSATLVTGSAGSGGSSGLSSGGKIAIAVVVPIVAIAAIAAALLFFWKKRKARKAEEEERKQEMEEYGFNPNNDPTLPPVGGTSVGDDSEIREDSAGYRGWGTTTNSNRKASTTLSSGRGLVGAAHSDEGSSQPGGYSYVQQHSPSEQDTFVNEPLGSYNYDNRPVSDEYQNGIGTALGGGAVTGAAVAGRDDKDMHRGLSNASSGYSGRPHSEAASEDTGGVHANYNDYYEMQPQHGPYGDGTYGGGQPVIRDVQARRNTRIEKPSVFPHSGNSGIAANF